MVVFYNLLTFVMHGNIEQRYAIKFCVKLNKSATETFDSLTEAYGDATLSRTMVSKWHKAFKEGQENVEDNPRSGRPMSSTNDQNVEVTRAVMAKDRRVSVRMIAEEMGLDKTSKTGPASPNGHCKQLGAASR
jgi:transposase